MVCVCDPFVGKAKMRLRIGSFFNFQKLVAIIQLFFHNFSKTTASQTYFEFNNKLALSGPSGRNARPLRGRISF